MEPVLLDDGVSKLIGRIYDGIEDPAALQAAADEMLDRMGAAFGLIATADCENATFAKVEWLNRLGSAQDRIVAEYQGEMQAIDPAFAHIARRPESRLLDTARDLPGAFHETHPYMRWFRARFGSSHWLLGYTPPSGPFSLGISVQPYPNQVFGVQERALLQLLFDHFERALRLAARLPRLDGDRALILVGPSGQALMMSPAAEVLLAAREGILLRNGVVEALHLPSRAALVGIIRSAMTALQEGGAGGMVALPRGPGRRPLIVSASPLPAPVGSLSAFYPGVLLHIADPEMAATPCVTDALRLSFGLTPAEARLAVALLTSDGNLRDVASQLDLAHNTVRAQLARIFEKTGTRTQGGLVRLLSLTSSHVRPIRRLS